MSAQTPFHFDSSLIGPRVYIKPGYRTFRQQLETTQQERASAQAQVQAQRAQVAQAQAAQPKAMLVEVPPRNVQMPMNLAAAPMQQQPTQKCVYIVRRVAGSQNTATLSGVPPSPETGYEMSHHSTPHHHYSHITHADPYSPGPLTPMSPPSGAPPSDVEIEQGHYMGGEGPMPAGMHPHSMPHPGEAGPGVLTHSHMPCHEAPPAREAMPVTLSASAPAMPAAVVEAGAALSGGYKLKDADGSSSFAVSCEHDTDSSRCHTDSDEHTSDTNSDGGKTSKTSHDSRAQVPQGAGSELLQALAGVRISQPCKVVINGLAEAHADAGRIEEAATSFGDVESCYVRARDNHKSFAGIVVFKEEANAADFREAVRSGTAADALGCAVAATMGTTRYCPRFLKNVRCRDGCCPYVHSLVDTSAYAL